VTQRRVHERWAQLRFSVIGQLLAAPPAAGALRLELDKLAAREWRHPVTGAPVRFGLSTIERWYYRARKERHDPVAVLRRKRRQDAGQQAAMGEALRQALLAQYAAHNSWSVKLHWDNLVALAERRPELQPVPSYSTVRRFLEAHGLDKRRPLTARLTAGALLAEARLAEREVRSYEAEYINSLWHWDLHHASRKVLTPRGEWQTPLLLGILDDRSRIACHLQWYLAETAENVAHGLSQAIQKRGLPRAAMSDNGAAMTAAEITEGLARLGILHQTTLPYSPYQNAKQEAFWGPVEGRLMAMLEDVPDLTLAMLNETTQAWVEYEYNRKIHSETGEAPIARFLAGPEVTRPSPDSTTLKLAFTRTERRTLRKSDGTITIEGRRFEAPNRYRHLTRLELRFASWDLALVHLVDEHTGTVLCRSFPQDKTRNASALRLIAGVLIAEPTALLLVEVEREAQAAVDPTLADLAQSPYSPRLGQGVCDLRQACGVGDRRKAVSFLGKTQARFARLAGDIFVAVQDNLGGERRMPADLDRQMAPIAVEDVERIVVDIRHRLFSFDVMLGAHIPHRRLGATNQDQEQALGDGRLGQIFLGQIVLALPCGTVDHRNAVGRGVAADAPAEAAGHPHQVGILQRLVGPGQRPPPHAEPAGIMSHPEIGVQDNSIHAVVAAAQQVLVESAQPIRHPGSVQLPCRPPQTAPQGPLFRSPVCEKA
jgi:putative transposase